MILHIILLSALLYASYTIGRLEAYSNVINRAKYRRQLLNDKRDGYE